MSVTMTMMKAMMASRVRVTGDTFMPAADILLSAFASAVVDGCGGGGGDGGGCCCC